MKLRQSAIVWFDAFISNVDRTTRNPNLLIWRQKVWLIDHGASLYFHHSGDDWLPRAQAAFPLIREHILVGRADDLAGADARLRPRLTEEAVRRVVDDVPAEWLAGDVAAMREAYVAYLLARLNGPRAWLEEAERARRAR